MFDVLTKYEILCFFGLCLNRLKFSEPKLGLSRQNTKYHWKWRLHPLIHTHLKSSLTHDIGRKVPTKNLQRLGAPHISKLPVPL